MNFDLTDEQEAIRSTARDFLASRYTAERVRAIALDGATAEQRMVEATVRQFVEAEMMPHEAAVERSGEVPRELGEALKRNVIDLGFYAPNMPAAIGGGGLDHVTFAILERERGRTSLALSVFWGRPSNVLLACSCATPTASS